MTTEDDLTMPYGKYIWGKYKDYEKVYLKSPFMKKQYCRLKKQE